MESESRPRLGPINWGEAVTLVADVGSLRRGDGGDVVAFDTRGADGRIGLLVEIGDGSAHVIPRERLEPYQIEPNGAA